MHIFREVGALRAWVRGQKQQGHRVGFVPTMGNLHAGHFSLIEIARRHCDRIVASVFVNPTQFGEGEDFGRYPRTPDADAKGLRDHGCDALFLPEVGEIYPFGAAQGVCVHVPGLSDALEGAARPGHFDGVASVVCRLFNLVQPDLAVFGSKDYQQLLVVRRMATDLGFPLEILGAPIVREANGLAMSSRNSYLKPEERQVAAGIFASLTRAATELREHKQDIAALEARCLQELSALGMRPEYISVRSALDLSLPKAGDKDLIILAAAWLGGARLIDNVRVMLNQPLEA